MTAVRIAHTEPWPGNRAPGRGFGFFSMLVVLADDSGSRALPVWLNGPEGHGLYRGRDDDHAFPETAEAITAGLLRAAGVTVTGIDIDELDPALTTGPRRGHPAAQAATRIGFTATGTAEPHTRSSQRCALSWPNSGPAHAGSAHAARHWISCSSGLGTRALLTLA